MLSALRALAFPSCALVALLSSGCDVIAPPPPPPDPPEPGWYGATPARGVRSLNDVILLEPRDAEAPGFPAYHGYAVGTGGTILRLDRDAEGLVTWTAEPSGTEEDLESIDVTRFRDGEDEVELAMAVGHEGTVVRRNDDGTWSPVPSGTTAVLFDITFRNERDGFVVGEAGTILRWDGAALAAHTTHTLQEVIGGACPVEGCGANSQCIDGACHSFFPLSEALKGVGDAGAMIAVGAAGAVYRYDADGEPTGATNRWIREDAGTQRTLAGIFTDAGVWVPTIDGVLMRRNGDDDWDDESFRVPSPVFLQDVWVRDGVFAVGLSEDLYHLDDEGLWNLTQVADAAEMRGIDGVRFDLPPGAVGNEDGDEPLRVQEVIAVGGGGRIARGPLVLPSEGEALLPTRVADDDFID